MISDLRAVMKDKTYAEINFIDGDSVVGFVTFVGADRFHIMTLEAVMPNVPDDQKFYDEDGNLMVQIDPSEISYIPTKHSYNTDLVSSVKFDVSHRLEPEMLKSLFFLRDNQFYKTTKTNASNRKSPKTTKKSEKVSKTS